MTDPILPETRWFRPDDLKRGPDGLSPLQMERAMLMSMLGLPHDNCVECGTYNSCPECHGTGFADENRPCEHPRY